MVMATNVRGTDVADWDCNSQLRWVSRGMFWADIDIITSRVTIIKHGQVHRQREIQERDAESGNYAGYDWLEKDESFSGRSHNGIWYWYGQG
jgi:hypothetical protein